eukprot:Gb_24367 [translate_table: standard]
MDVEKASLCNCVVNFLLQENYLLTAFELLHELLEDGRESQALRLKEFFADTDMFPPDQMFRLHNLRETSDQGTVGIPFELALWLYIVCAHNGSSLILTALFANVTFADPQSLLEEKEAAEEKAAISEYELRLAQEDITKLKIELGKRVEASSSVNLDG